MFKVGDKVRIKKGVNISSWSMDQADAGTIMTVTSYNGRRFRIDLKPENSYEASWLVKVIRPRMILCSE